MDHRALASSNATLLHAKGGPWQKSGSRFDLLIAKSVNQRRFKVGSIGARTSGKIRPGLGEGLGGGTGHAC